MKCRVYDAKYAIKNKSFSDCTVDIKEKFESWLYASHLSESEFVKTAKNEFSIAYTHTINGVNCSLCSNGTIIGEPFISPSGKTNDIRNFNTDLSLLLLYIANVIKDDAITKYIQGFVDSKQK